MLRKTRSGLSARWDRKSSLVGGLLRTRRWTTRGEVISVGGVGRAVVWERFTVGHGGGRMLAAFSLVRGIGRRPAVVGLAFNGAGGRPDGSVPEMWCLRASSGPAAASSVAAGVASVSDTYIVSLAGMPALRASVPI